VRIRQQVYFGIQSEDTTAANLTGQIGVEPDSFSVRGSRSATPPRPLKHEWRVECDDGGLSVEDQVQRIVDRLLPYQGRIAAVVAEIRQKSPGDGSRLQIVRHFNDDEGDEESDGEVSTSGVSQLERLGGQHQLLGWHLSSEVVAFLCEVQADIDCDEFG